jgi:hypothetical protein
MESRREFREDAASVLFAWCIFSLAFDPADKTRSCSTYNGQVEKKKKSEA